MKYQKIVAVSGISGLFEIINTKSDGAIVRSLEDKTVRFVSSRNHQLTPLENIEVYTTGRNVNLSEVFEAMEKAGEPLPDGKDADNLKQYFKKVFPSMDFDRVYHSDMKKMVKWFFLLKRNNVAFQTVDIQTSSPEAESEATAEKPKEEPVENTPEKEENESGQQPKKSKKTKQKK
ncbi:MAG: DUF5606 domain-containing protein [Chitinophagaceae bacterium]|nr:DUF5606 domain-containing protein [Chitinophagaceae bacterium]